MSKQIHIDIEPDGQIKIEAVGFKGAACEKATAAMEQALGKVGSRKRKAEYWQSEVKAQQKVGGS